MKELKKAQTNGEKNLKLMNWKNQYCWSVHATPGSTIKISITLFTEIENKFMKNNKKIQIAKAILTKNKVKGSALPDFKMYL